MTQEQVIRILEKTRKWMSSKEMAKTLRVSHRSISNCATKVFKTTNEIERRLVINKKSGLMYLWRIKKRK